MDYLMSFIESAGYLAYGVLFLIIFLESFPPTLFLPGDSLLFITGFLASQGYFDIVLLVGILFIASVLGYIFSYSMGKKIRNFILNSNDKYWFKKRHLEYTEKFYKKYGNKTLVLGRFIPIVRSFSPTLAGAVEMDHKQFIKYVLIGGFLWIGGIISIGFYLGRIIPNAEKLLTPIILSIIFISLLPTILGYFVKRTKNTKDDITS
ncbi:MAG: DedA family protein [Patescibacteria group bacterium]